MTRLATDMEKRGRGERNSDKKNSLVGKIIIKK
jgi:hypothetical protein